ncbi:MAG TPA: hypothetical protein VMU56_03550 [Beijerinckiaceae bacterium]|nr:hypothetical protein [Beijerinckiaceae bacterium]
MSTISAAGSKRPGRKRAPGQRTPSGQLSRKIVEEIGGQNPACVMRLVHDSLRGYAEPVYGAPLGRLFLEGKLSAPEFEAGKRWDRLMRRYHKAMAAPRPDPKSVALDRIGATRDADPDSQAGKDEVAIDRAIVNAFEDAHALIAAHGAEAERDMRALCEGAGEYPRGYQAFNRTKAVLSGLANFWGLTKTRK